MTGALLTLILLPLQLTGSHILADSIAPFSNGNYPLPIWSATSIVPLDSGLFSIGAGIEPYWVPPRTQQGMLSQSSGWGAIAGLTAQAKTVNARWEARMEGRYWRVPNVSGAWHEAAYNWGFLDGWGRAQTPQLNAVAATRFEGYIAHRISPSIQCRAGKFSRHWGHGWRSVWWDQAAAPMPQISLELDAGKVRYLHVIGTTRHWKEGSPPDLPGWDVDQWAPWRFADKTRAWLAAHSVSADLGRGFQGTLFGAITWLPNDSGYTHRFETAYAIPFVAFRPTEYRLGSADNALIGLEGAWQSPNRNWLVSSQWMLDEWVSSEVFGGRGWWANKWASVQTLRWHKDKVQVWAERCAVRPYTYSHAAPETAWTNDRSPIAHPHGSNFIEWRMHGILEWNTFRFHLGGTFLKQGVHDVADAVAAGRSLIVNTESESSFSLGTSPLLSYVQRLEEEGIAAVYTGNGLVSTAGIVETWRGFADVEWANERLGFGKLFMRLAGRWAEGESAAGEVTQGNWSRIEFGLRVNPALEERDW